MTVASQRRQLLKLAAAVPMAVPVLGLDAGFATGTLARHEVRDQYTGLRTDDSTAVVIVDTGVTAFAGDGYYLYPDWGKPVVYEVRAVDGGLAFHYPGASRALWTVASPAQPVLFSGRVESLVDATDVRALAHIDNLPVLAVPALPAG